MIKLAKARLLGLGYEVLNADSGLLESCCRKAEGGIRNFCNLSEDSEIPDGLCEILTDRICGEFLLLKRGSLRGLGVSEDSAAVKQIAEGDVSVTYAEGTSPAERLDKLIERLLNSGERELVRFRKIRWTK